MEGDHAPPEIGCHHCWLLRAVTTCHHPLPPLPPLLACAGSCHLPPTASAGGCQLPLANTPPLPPASAGGHCLPPHHWHCRHCCPQMVPPPSREAPVVHVPQYPLKLKSISVQYWCICTSYMHLCMILKVKSLYPSSFSSALEVMYNFPKVYMLEGAPRSLTMPLMHWATAFHCSRNVESWYHRTSCISLLLPIQWVTVIPWLHCSNSLWWESSAAFSW